MKKLLLFVLLIASVVKAEDFITVSTDSFRGGVIKLKAPTEKPKFLGMAIQCNLNLWVCYWTCPHGFNFSTVLKGDQFIDEATGCVEGLTISNKPWSGLLYGDTVYHGVPN